MRVRRRVLAAVALLAIVMPACSNEDDDGTTADATSTVAETEATTTSAGDSATTTTAAESATTAATDTTAEGPFAGLERMSPPTPCPEIPGVNDTTIRVGALLPQSGPRATSFGPALDGIRARIEKANAEDELGGRTIELIDIDDGSDAARNAEAARTLVEQDGVYGIIEVSDQSDGSADYLHDDGIPVTGWHVGRAHWGYQENFFAYRLPGAADPNRDHTNRTAGIIEELGGTRVAVVGGGNDSSVAFVEREVQAAESLGLEVVYVNTEVVSGNTEFTGVVQRISESGADSLITGMDFLQNTALSQQLADAGVEMTATIFPGGYDPRVLSVPGVEGAVFGLEFFPFESNPPAYAAFDEWMPDDAVRNQITYIGWLSAEVFVQGLIEAGLECPTREAFITNLRLLDGYTGGGAFDPIDFISLWGKPFPCAYYVRVENGAFVPMFDGEERCGDFIEVDL